MLPILYQSSDLVLYSYPLFMGLGWGVAYQIFFSLIPASMPKFHAQFLFWGIFISSWLGAKLLFYLTLPPELSGHLLEAMSFWTGGGFVFYGGLLAGMLFIVLYRFLRFTFNPGILWAIVPAVTFGHGIGRIGCFLAGCCYGEITTAAWGVFLHGHHRHPTQLLEALSLLLLGSFLLKSRRPPASLASYYLVFYGLIRLATEALRGDGIRGHWGVFTPSQWISMLLILLGVLVLFRSRNSKIQRA
ncbi:MAG TPA: prolipoprotein diacylglyceryl transferase family protein [Bacteriovoracaceae bacterium]|nr:prolipoprotein diacylglyceryl transferase family protein [Bacteriovoracaceae bacterium]